MNSSLQRISKPLNNSAKHKHNNDNVLNFPMQNNIIDKIALECLKKSNFSGNSNEVIAEYIRMRGEVEKQLSTATVSKEDHDVYKQTVFDDYIICLEDGKKMQMLKRHLKTHYNMTFQEYKEKWRLPMDYPCVCKGYSNIRAKIASKRGKTKKEEI